MTVLVSECTPSYIVWHEGQECCDAVWEAAYTRFESPEEEIQKFERRLRQLGVADWPKSLRVVELFCGRGNGLCALAKLGFTNLEGVDLAGTLLNQYQGEARLYQGDCRDLKFPDQSRDVLVVQGGLHHLPNLHKDLEQTFSEIHRVLVPGGKLIVVEPWNTLFLRGVHLAARQRWLRHLSPKVDALQTMIEREETTYNQWLSRPQQILELLEAYFKPLVKRRAWGKLMYVGTKH